MTYKHLTKAALIKRIKTLEHEIDEILSFGMLPVIQLSDTALATIQQKPGFIHVCQYAHPYCIHQGEVGYLKGVRYTYGTK